MRIFKLTNLVLDLNEVFHSGIPLEISSDAVNRHIEQGTIFEFLIARLPCSGSIAVLDPVDRLELLLEWNHLYQRRDRFGLDRFRNGWCLMVWYVMEGIARRCERKGYRLSTETCGAAFAEQEPVAPVVQRPPTGEFCTTCKKPWDPRMATAETGRDAICFCCYKKFCEFCLYDHQKSPDYDNPFLRGKRKAEGDKDQSGSPTE